MSYLKNPGEIIMLTPPGILYGPPGHGKTTLGLSAPDPVLIDADLGMHRVEARFQTMSLPLTDYDDFRGLIESDELAPFKSIVIDPVGRLIQRIAEWVMAEDPKLRKRDGSLTLPGFGRLRTEFQRLLGDLKKQKKMVVFIAHDREEREDDERKIRPDLGQGSSGQELLKDLDWIGYVQKTGNEPVGFWSTISFTPCDRFYAKNPYNLPASIRIQDTASHPNDFISNYLLVKAAEKKAADEEQTARYRQLVADHKTMIEKMTDAKSANDVAEHMRDAPVIWDSQRQARHAFAEKLKELGLTYDREAKQYVPYEVSPITVQLVERALASVTEKQGSPAPSATGEDEVPADFDDRAAAE